MAAVTVNAYRSNVDGTYREGLYNVTIGSSGDTMAITSMRNVKSMSSNDVAITKMAAAVTATGSTITFTTTGAVSGALVRIQGN